MELAFDPVKLGVALPITKDRKSIHFCAGWLQKDEVIVRGVVDAHTNGDPIALASNRKLGSESRLRIETRIADLERPDRKMGSVGIELGRDRMSLVSISEQTDVPTFGERPAHAPGSAEGVARVIGNATRVDPLMFVAPSDFEEPTLAPPVTEIEFFDGKDPYVVGRRSGNERL